MKRFLILSFCLLLVNTAYANEDLLVKQNTIQSRIDRIGTEILNANQLEKRVLFVYDKPTKIKALKDSKTLSKRQVIIYSDAYPYIENDDELAGYIARKIPIAIRSYNGVGNGWLSSLKIKAAPKKYEILSDKLAVDYMVKAGYNPLGLITLIHKTCPQARQDTFSGSNLTSKRLAYIYERIYTKYPYFLVNNTYLDNPYYQNFLLTSRANRKLVQLKVENPKRANEYKYE